MAVNSFVSIHFSHLFFVSWWQNRAVILMAFLLMHFKEKVKFKLGYILIPQIPVLAAGGSMTTFEGFRDRYKSSIN